MVELIYMKNFERPAGVIFISEDEMRTLSQTSEEKQQVTVRKPGLPPTIGDNIQLSLPDGLSAVGRVINVTKVEIEDDISRNEILLEIQPD